MQLTFDIILRDFIKPIGKWQISTFLLVIIPNTIPLIYILRLPNIAPKHVCAAPWQITQGWNFSSVLNLSMAIRNELNATMDLNCYRFSNSHLFYHGNSTSTSGFAPEPCSMGQWLYDEATKEFRHSLVESFDLVCDRKYFISMTPVSNLAGAFIGMLFGAVFSDHFGRKKVISILTPTVAVILFGVYFCNAYLLVVAAFFLLGVLSPVAHATGFVLCIEITDAKSRNIFAAIDGLLCHLVGEGCILLLAYFTQDWRLICVGAGAIISISFSYTCLLPESPKWLIAKGRNKEALTTIKSAILANGDTPERREMASELSAEKIMRNPDQEENNSSSMIVIHELAEVLRSYWRFLSGFRRSWIPLSVVWFCFMITAYGISFYAVRLSFNPYLMVLMNFLISALPAKMLQWLLYRYFDRKCPVIVLSLTSALMCFTAFSISFYSPDHVAIVVLVSLVICIISCLWTMLQLLSSEQFPTLHRTNALGFIKAVGYMGSASGMFVERLDVYVWRCLPLLVYGIGQSMCALGILLLPRESSSDTVKDRPPDQADTAYSLAPVDNDE